MAMTIGEYFAAIEAAPPGERWKVAGALNRRMCNDDRRWAAAWLGDFICALGEPEIVTKVPKGLKLGPPDAS